MIPSLKRTIVFAALITVTASTSLFCQTHKEQLNAIIRETQKQGNRAGRLTLVWWLPPEFWRATLSAGGTVPADKIQDMVGAISDVNVFIVVDGKSGGFGSLEYVPQAELEKNLSIVGTDGKPLALIPEAKQSGATKNLLAMMKPLMTNMLGELGKNISFFVFEGKNKSGSRLLDPMKPGSFTVRLGGEEFRWRLPLGSLLPPKICPKCNEAFPGNYAFCPFDATPLKEQLAGKK